MTPTDAIAMLCWLLIAHALCDYPLQGDFLARAKNLAEPIPGVPWGWAMAAHCGIHAGAVWHLTGSGVLAACEFAVHFWIDMGKCLRVYSFSFDQILHVACKVGWVAALLLRGPA